MPLGSASSSLVFSVSCWRMLCVSTTGAAPLTVIVSSSEPTLHRDVHRRREPGAELDAVALDRREAGQREGHRVGAGPKVDDGVATFAVGRDRADFFDQRRAGGFDRHARHRQARRVADHARDAAGLLGVGG